MIRHIVMWNVAGATHEDKRRNFELLQDRFHSLRGRIRGEAAPAEHRRGQQRGDYACDVVLYSEFESQAALDDYANHPEHLRIRDELAGVRVARHQVDYEVRATQVQAVEIG